MASPRVAVVAVEWPAAVAAAALDMQDMSQAIKKSGSNTLGAGGSVARRRAGAGGHRRR